MTLRLAALLLLAVPTLTLSTLRAQQPVARSLAERLGLAPTAMVLIVNGDDVGVSHAANQATIDSLERGLMTSATIMIPAPWFPEIARYAREHPRADFGVHLVHTSEWTGIKWGPVAGRTVVPGLVDPQGYLWPDIERVYSNATPEQAAVEARAQIRKALDAGIDVTHLDSHMGALQYAEPYFQVYRALAREFNLPIRMGSQQILAAFGGGHQRGQLDHDGVVYTDDLIHGGRQKGEAVQTYWRRMIEGLRPGVTELYIHAALAGEEMQAVTNSWKDRAAEFELFTNDASIRALLERKGVQRIGYRALRDLQRGAR
ncbi:MAG: polysaccharide deacetylase family protein [Vicinamibacteria bacterium]|nr:polysaccharide deacetylase family protein [Vicinamibacteria bacterium]